MLSLVGKKCSNQQEHKYDSTIIVTFILICQQISDISLYFSPFFCHFRREGACFTLNICLPSVLFAYMVVDFGRFGVPGVSFRNRKTAKKRPTNRLLSPICWAHIQLICKVYLRIIRLPNNTILNNTPYNFYRIALLIELLDATYRQFVVFLHSVE